MNLFRRARRVGAGASLRVRLVAVILALTAVGLVAAGVVATVSLHANLMDRVDSQLRGFSRSPSAVPGRSPSGVLPTAPTRVSSGRRLPSEFYAAALAPDGTLTVDSVQGSRAAPQLSGLTVAQARARLREPFTVKATSGSGTWRVETLSAPGSTSITVIGLPLSDIQHTVDSLALLQLAVGGGVLVLMGVGASFLVRRSLRPLGDVERVAAAIAGGDLSRRVADHDPRTEVGRLSLALNGMLSQIEAAFERQRTSEVAARDSEQRMRRFVADASHELRTPLTSIRGFAELHRMGAATEPADVVRMFGRVEDEAARMGLLVDDLLLLARLDQQRPLEQAPVDLVEIAADVVHDAASRAPDRVVTLTAHEAPLEVTGDDARLRQVVTNLVTNALVHTPAGTPVEVCVGSEEAERAVLDVVDHGPGLSEAERAKVFERFYRGDASRSRAAGGNGLGLSIVAGLVAAQGGSVAVVETPGGGATFRVELPRRR